MRGLQKGRVEKVQAIQEGGQDMTIKQLRIYRAKQLELANYYYKVNDVKQAEKYEAIAHNSSIAIERIKTGSKQE